MKAKISEIDPKKLVYFAVLVDIGSFRKAATALEISQPALSKAIGRVCCTGR